VVGSSNRTVFCGKFAVVGCDRVKPADVVPVPAAGLPKAMLPKPVGFAPALAVAAGIALYSKNK